MFDPDGTADLEDDLRYPVFYADGRRAGLTDAPTFVSRLVHVAGPAWDVATTPAEAKAALDLASMAWNVTRLPQAQRLEALGVAVRSLVAHTGDAADFSEMVLLAMRWPDEQRVVAEVLFKELHPGEWHVALLTITPADVRRRASSRGAKPRAPRRG